MARLHEYQGKKLLKEFNILTPKGGPAKSALEARKVAEEIGGEVVIKAQVWVTGRASIGAIRFASDPLEAGEAAAAILGMKIKNYVVDTLMIEEKVAVKKEFYAGVIIDDQSQSPLMIFSSIGGSGIEQISKEHPEAVSRIVINIRDGLKEYQARDLVRETGLHGKLQMGLAGLLVKLYEVARHYNARSAEINPIVLTEDNKLMAADCRITLDDNAVYRFPELGIEMAREFDRPPTGLELTAWQVEKNDYRGTFYFIQMEQDFEKGDDVIGFHGAGGGGSMMSMDALLNQGFKLANFVDTSGNPPASKVYRAARIILAQEGIDGYFASGSGVASQEQFHSARGLVKAFMEEPLMVPAVIRLGGNAEERAINILERARKVIPAPVEGYGKDDTPEFCVSRMAEMIHTFDPQGPLKKLIERPEPEEPYTFDTVTGGKVILDHAVCKECESKICIKSCVAGILSLENGLPVLNISKEEAKAGKCIECLACDVECYFEGARGGRIILPIEGLEER